MRSGGGEQSAVSIQPH